MSNVDVNQYSKERGGKFREKVKETSFKLTTDAWSKMEASSSAAGRPGDFTSLFKAYKRMEYLESSSASGVTGGEVAGFVALKNSGKILKTGKSAADLGVHGISTKLASTNATKTSRQAGKDGSLIKQ